MRQLRDVAVFALALAVWGGAAVAQPGAWEQSAVAALARQLADAAGALHEEIRKQPDERPVGVLGDDTDLLERDARHLEQRAESLAAMLGDGQGREQTAGAFRTFDTTLRDVAEEARSRRLTEPVRGAWTEVDRLHLELARYYGEHDPHPQLEDVRPR